MLLDAPAEILLARKQELSAEEILRQRNAYLAMVRELPNGHVINAAQSPEQVVAEIRRRMLDCMVKRQAHRE
jgi:thymidylate kinase